MCVREKERDGKTKKLLPRTLGHCSVEEGVGANKMEETDESTKYVPILKENKKCKRYCAECRGGSRDLTRGHYYTLRKIRIQSFAKNI